MKGCYKTKDILKEELYYAWQQCYLLEQYMWIEQQ